MFHPVKNTLRYKYLTLLKLLFCKIPRPHELRYLSPYSHPSASRKSNTKGQIQLSLHDQPQLSAKNNNNNVFSLLKLLSKFSTKLISNFLPSLQTPNSHDFLLFAEEMLSNKKSCNFWLLSSLYTLLTPSNLVSASIKEVFKITNEILCQSTFNLIFQKDLTKLINWIFEAFSSPAW